MTDDQRELAEWVAAWAGWKRGSGNEANFFHAPPLWIHEDRVLLNEVLAWRAENEHIALKGDPETSAYMVKRIMEMVECDRKEATFRALRAARGEG